MKSIQLYYDYFEHQAINHVDLRHADVDGQRVFAIIDIDKALGDFRSGQQPQGYMMRLINYTYSVGQRTHQMAKELQGGFIIAKNFDPRGLHDEYLAAMVAAERVMDEVISKMVLDSRNGHPLFDNYFDAEQDVNVQPVLDTGDGTYCGWMCIFTTQQFFSNCSNPDPDRWDDGGTTPLP